MSIRFFYLYHTLDVQNQRFFSYRLEMTAKEEFNSVSTFCNSILQKLT